MQVLTHYLVNTFPRNLTEAAYILYKNNVTFPEKAQSIKESAEIVTARKAVKEAEENLSSVTVKYTQAVSALESSLAIKEKANTANEAAKADLDKITADYIAAIFPKKDPATI